MKQSVWKRSMVRCFGTAILGAAVVAGSAEAEARYYGRGYAAGVIGGMSAGAILGSPYYPGYGFGYYPGYPAPVYQVAPLGPPPGCVIRRQRVWDGYRWQWRKLRICH